MAITSTPLRPLTWAIPQPAAQEARTGYAAFAARYPDFIREVQHLRGVKRIALDRLRYSARRVQREQVRHLLVSRELHLFYAYEGLRKAKRLGTATPDSVRELAVRCDPFSPAQGGVARCEIVKRGRPRTVDIYSPFKRMQQALVGDLVRALHPPRPEQFLFNGGMPKALRAIEAAYEAGAHWAVQVDLIDFYRSVPFTELAELLRPLPAQVTEHVVWDQPSRCALPLVSTQGVGRLSPSLNGSPGLSLGSATSPIVAETIIGRVLAQLPPGQQVVTYADNMLVFGHDAEEALARAQDLARLFENFPELPLRLRHGEVASFTPRPLVADPSLTGVDFAHQFATVSEGKLSWAPTEDRRLEYRTDDINALMSIEEVNRMEHRVARWRRAYPTWRDGHVWETECLALLAGVRYFREPQPLHLAAAVNAIIAALVACQHDHPVGNFVPDALGNRDHERRHLRLVREVNRFLDDSVRVAA